jgi:hypothetical protein
MALHIMLEVCEGAAAVCHCMAGDQARQHLIFFVYLPLCV